MSEETKTEPKGATETEAAEASGSAEPRAEEAKPDLQAEVARLRDQLLRTAADFDNFRKRSRKEQDDAQKRGQSQSIKDLLPVFDNLERAAQHADSATDVKAVADGVRMVLKQFESTLEKMNIKRIVTAGAAFDPAMHEAIQHMESADKPAGVVLHEVQAGYLLGEQLLRAAMVVVSKGPAQEAPLPN